MDKTIAPTKKSTKMSLENSRYNLFVVTENGKYHYPSPPHRDKLGYYYFVDRVMNKILKSETASKFLYAELYERGNAAPILKINKQQPGKYFSEFKLYIRTWDNRSYYFYSYPAFDCKGAQYQFEQMKRRILNEKFNNNFKFAKFETVTPANNTLYEINNY